MRKIGLKRRSKEVDSTNSSSLKGSRSDEVAIGENNLCDKSLTKDQNIKVRKDSKSESNKSFECPNDEEFEVQALIDQKIEEGVSYFLIRWKGYGADADTWEPESDLSCPELISKFNKRVKTSQLKKTKGSKKKTSKHLKKNIVNYDCNTEWEVERVVDVLYEKDGSRFFRIKWKGYKSSSNTWEPEENLNCKNLIEKFTKQRNSSGNIKKDLREYPKKTQHFATNTFGRRASKRNVGKLRTVYYDAE